MVVQTLHRCTGDAAAADDAGQSGCFGLTNPWGSRGTQTRQLLQPLDPELWWSMAHSPYCPKLEPMSSANSPRTLVKRPHLPSSPVQVWGIRAILPGERHRQQSPNRCRSTDQTTHHSWLVQTSFPASNLCLWQMHLVQLARTHDAHPTQFGTMNFELHLPAHSWQG